HINPVQDINYSPVDVDQNNMINKALKERKELKHFLYTRENLNLDLSDAKSTDDSSLSLNASFRRRGEQPRLNGALNGIEQDSWSIGATVTIPLDDNGTTKSRTAQILSQIFDLSVSIRRTKDRISFEVNEAIRNLQSTKVRYEILEKTLKLAAENLSIDELRFSRGVIASNDLQRTQLELLQLKVDRFSALVDYKLSEIELTKAVGVLGTDSL
ncbi:MAG: TolC family protein, partial [Gammaproteobacteria bacterium]|nr:TolC family protein [Gammaproteobacteria bacterium]